MINQPETAAEMERDDLFPLRCSAFEKYLLTDECPTHPMTSYVELDLVGTVDCCRLQQSLQRALQRHPLMHALIRNPHSQTAEWIPATTPILVRTFNCGHPQSREEEIFDLTREPGLRTWLKTGDVPQTLTVYAHHVCADALGLLTFIMEWLKEYAEPGALQKYPAPDWHGLRHRENLQTTTASFSLPKRIVRIARTLFGKSPTPLAVPRSDSTSVTDPPVPGYSTAKLTSDEFQTLRALTRERQVSLNDWISAATFRAIDTWNRDAGETGRSLFRIVVPVNRRAPGERHLSACNKISYKILNRSRVQIQNFSTLLSGIHSEMEFVRQHPQGVFSFLKMLQTLDRFGLMNRAVQRYGCFATVVLSNLGDVTRHFGNMLETRDHLLVAGDLTLQAMRCSPPRRPNTNATVAVFSYGGELHFISRGEDCGLNHIQTELFLRHLKQTIIETMNENR